MDLKVFSSKRAERPSQPKLSNRPTSREFDKLRQEASLLHEEARRVRPSREICGRSFTPLWRIFTACGDCWLRTGLQQFALPKTYCRLSTRLINCCRRMIR